MDGLAQEAWMTMFVVDKCWTRLVRKKDGGARQFPGEGTREAYLGTVQVARFGRERGDKVAVGKGWGSVAAQQQRASATGAACRSALAPL